MITKHKILTSPIFILMIFALLITCNNPEPVEFEPETPLDSLSQFFKIWGGPQSDRPRFIVPNSGQGCLILGTSSEEGSAILWSRELDKNYELADEQILVRSSSITFEDYLLDPDGNLLVLTTMGETSQSFWLTKLNHNLDVSWTATLDSSVYIEANSLVHIPGSGYGVLGRAGAEMILIKYSIDGDELWRQTFSDSLNLSTATTLRPRSLTVDNNGGFYMGAISFRNYGPFLDTDVLYSHVNEIGQLDFQVRIREDVSWGEGRTFTWCDQNMDLIIFREWRSNISFDRLNINGNVVVSSLVNTGANYYLASVRQIKDGYIAISRHERDDVGDWDPDHVHGIYSSLLGNAGELVSSNIVIMKDYDLLPEDVLWLGDGTYLVCGSINPLGNLDSLFSSGYDGFLCRAGEGQLLPF